MRRLLLLGLAALTGCGSPREVAPPPPAPAYGAVSSVHYRDFESADALAEYLRWRPGAPALISARRGGPSPGLPENALATFEYALNFAPALIEVDVRQAADGTLVLLHDEALDRTTTGTGPVAARTLTELRALYLLDPEGTVTPHRIPTLAEALAWAEARAVLMLDVKEGVPPEAVVAAVREADAEDRTVVAVSSPNAWAAFYHIAPNLVYAVPAATPAAVEMFSLLSAQPLRLIASAGTDAVDPAVVEQLHALGVRVQANPSGPAAYRPLLDAGVDVLTTDDVPSAARATR